jgi:serine/threonine protein kinase
MEPIADKQSPGVELSTRELIDMGCGRPIGRYTLLRRIAAGGMAEVYVASSRGHVAGFEKKVAIKKILPQHSHNERFIDMLVDEAKITVSLTHPNIAQVHELGLDGEDYFIAMEYVDGRPLNRLMQRVDERGLSVIPIEHCVHIMGEVSKGLEHAHKQRDSKGRPLGIVHRDISPQNVLISYHGDVKLIDFGIARAEGRVNRTSHGVIKGKLRYLAPEIAAGDEPDHRADIFCCGIVLFEMLTGEAMFAPKTDLDAIEMATQARVKSPRSRNPKVPQDLDDIVMKALRRDRNERYQTCKDLYGDLRRFLTQTYPAFLGSELADFMTQMFSKEIAQERRMDEVSERVARRKLGGSFDEEIEEDPTLAASPGALIGEPRGYKQIVTRLGIGEDRLRVLGADGGRDMSVVPAGSGERPPIRGPTESRDRDHPGTLPPAAERGEAGVEPTVRSDNPFIGQGSVLPTITGPAPEISQNPTDEGLHDTRDDSDRRDRENGRVPIPKTPERTASLELWEGIESDVIVPGAPTHKNVFGGGPSTGIRIRRGPNVAYLLAFVGTVFAMGGAAWLITPAERPVVIEPKPDPTIELQPIPIEPPPPIEPAELILQVAPEGVPVTVHVDGRTKVTKAIPPIDLGTFEPEQIHRILVAADGYQSQELSRKLDSGTNEIIAVLRPALGTIKLKGVRGASVTTSHGAVRKERIVDIPLDSKVRVVVEWPGAKPFSTTVEVRTLDPVEVSIPAPKQLPKGLLVVNARPMSQVFIDKRLIGNTPQRLRLPAGTHRITLKSPDGRSKTFSKKVIPAKTTKVTFRW